ncbi:MAG: bifunctional protein-serine/threonine kinase/phosphatase, partial [Methylococcaceae bacterium]|nr:bifunctional protein-serine/threonine kinase/phosphatase [Methylococcaceae bacterium]
MTDSVLSIRAAYASRQGRRPDNQDFAGISQPRDRELALHGAVLAVADGMGGAAGGRVAAELCVRCFLEAWYALPETLGMENRVARALVSVNRWIHDLGRRAPELAGMGCTFSALILRGRRAYLVHVGDSRVYRLRGDSVEQLSEDHNLSGPDRRHILSRASGLDADLRSDFQEIPLEPHDRFLLCSDGLYEALRPAEIGRILMERTTAEATAATLADHALDQGGGDNITALVGDVLSLPEADRRSIRDYIAALSLREVPPAGSAVDGFLLKQRLSTGRYSVLFLAEDLLDRRTVVLKFPQPRVATEQEYCDAFLREAWIGARARSHWVAEVLEQPASRQSCLYSVMPHYPGRTLEQH